MSKKITTSLAALTFIASITATFYGWIVLSVVHPVPLAQVRVDMPVNQLPVVIREPAATVPQPIAVTRSSS